MGKHNGGTRLYFVFLSVIRSEGILATTSSSRAVDLGFVVPSDDTVNAVHTSQVRPPHSEDVVISGLPRLSELLSDHVA